MGKCLGMGHFELIKCTTEEMYCIQQSRQSKLKRSVLSNFIKERPNIQAHYQKGTNCYSYEPSVSEIGLC